MSNQTLVSQENILSILAQVVNDLKVKITNKDISLPYTTQLNKLSTLKIDGNGSMYLSNNGNYISLGSLSKSNLDINEINKIFNITTVADHWNSTGILPIPTAKYGLTSQIYNGKIYCIGGIVNGANSINTVSIYDIVSNTWTTGTTMPTSRYCLTSQLYNGKIYCIGGYSTSYSNIVEIYDIAGNTWTAGTAMPTARYGLTSQIYNGKIYCIGGQINTTTATNIVEIYDIAGNTWTAGTIMPTARQELTSQIYNGKIYCIGGQINTTTATNIVEIYNIITGAWTTSILPLPIAKYGLTSVQNNGKVYYIGGYTTTVTNTVDVLTLGVDNYTLTLPTDLQAKLDLIVDTGDGTKVLADNGTFIDIPLGYRFMTDTEVTSMVTTVNAYTG